MAKSSTPVSTLARSFRLALLATVCLAGTSFAVDDPTLHGPWSTKDVNAVVDAALTAADGLEPGSRASMLARFAGALQTSGIETRAHEVLSKAAGFLLPPTDYGSTSTRGTIVEKLAQLGAAQEATALARVDATDMNKATLLGKLGEGEAEAGNAASARKIAAEVAAIPAPPLTPATVPTDPTTIVANIGVALAAAGNIEDALKLSDPLPDGYQKLRVLDQAARSACDTKSAKHGKAPNSQELIDRVVKLARSSLSQPQPVGRPIIGEQLSSAIAAVDTIAECEGAAKAIAFVKDIAPNSTEWVLDRLFHQLVMRKELVLARAITPEPDGSDPQSLLDAAKRLQLLQDQAGALKFALQASQVALKSPPININAQPQLFAIFGTLDELGAYDAALATVQPIDALNRRQFYLNALQAAEAKKDRTALAHMLPAVLEIFKQPGPGTYQFAIIKTLAAGDDHQEAAALLGQLEILPAGKLMAGPGQLTLSQSILIKAAMGDLDGALAAAPDVGPMVDKPNGAQIALMTALAFDGARNTPTKDEIAAMESRVRTAMPALVAGPRAGLLVGMANDQAAQGNIGAAQKVAAQLDAEPSDILTDARDGVQASIANAQIKAGKPRDAFLTVAKIRKPNTRMPILQRLAAIKPNA